jgi:hypothetical protein
MALFVIGMWFAGAFVVIAIPLCLVILGVKLFGSKESSE